MTPEELLSRLDGQPIVGLMVAQPVRGRPDGRPVRSLLDSLPAPELPGSAASAGASGQATSAATATPVLPPAVMESRRAICEECDQWNDTFRSCRLGYPDVPDSQQRCVPCSWSKPDSRCLAEPPRWGAVISSPRTGS